MLNEPKKHIDFLVLTEFILLLILIYWVFLKHIDFFGFLVNQLFFERNRNRTDNRNENQMKNET